MDCLLKAGQRYREHYERVAQVDAEGWKTAKVRTRPVAKRVAQALIALAMRLDHSLTTQPMAQIRPVVTAQ